MDSQVLDSSACISGYFRPAAPLVSQHQLPLLQVFRPNEAHMVQGLAPDGCSYIAGMSLTQAILHSFA